MIPLTNPNLNGQYIFAVENVFPNEHLDFLKTYFTQDKLESAKIQSNIPENEEVRITDIAWLDPDDESTEPVYGLLHNLIKYVNDQHYHWNLHSLEPVQYGEYGEGGHYKLHTDTGLHNPMGSNRKLSFSILLNDDYEGGELEIPGSPGQPDSFNPPANSAIFFPSSMPHCVKPVTKGVRKSLVGWVHGPNFV
jgi:Rps23 Pro-64 3,4-dihydroxylase Tpa1-like proline 4-hydroxylase